MEENIFPKHVALIMDGNRRWAKREGLDTASGHKAGADTLKKIAKYGNDIGLKYMTVYAFSTENWKRSEIEVTAIMKILKNYMTDFFKVADDYNIKVNIIGDLENKVGKSLKESFDKVMSKTANNTGMTLNIAFNYGGRNEIINATKKIAQQVKDNEIEIEDINDELFSNNIYTANQPDPDLVIRTSGEERISNFLLWQIAYSELLFVEKFWPEFDEKDLDEAIKNYQNRNRKFGGK